MNIVNKAEQLEAIILANNPHVVTVTETWRRCEISDEDVFPPSYRVFRRDRPSRGGGVAVLVKGDIDAHFLSQIENHESIIIKLSCFGNSFLVFAVYRPPDSPPQFSSDLGDHMLTFKHENIFLVGDFNLSEPTICSK